MQRHSAIPKIITIYIVTSKAPNFKLSIGAETSIFDNWLCTYGQLHTEFSNIVAIAVLAQHSIFQRFTITLLHSHSTIEVKNIHHETNLTGVGNFKKCGGTMHIISILQSDNWEKTSFA